MPLDQALIGSALTGVLALCTQCVNKLRCYTSCKRDADGEICQPQCYLGFTESTLIETAEGLASRAVRAEQESSD